MPERSTIAATCLIVWLSMGSPAVAGCPGAPPIDFGPAWGAPPTGFVILTDQFADCGVLFSTDDPEGVYWIGEGGPSTFTYCIMAGNLYQPGGPPAGVDPIRIDFTEPVASVSIRGFDGGGDVDVLFLEAWGPGGILVDEIDIGGTFEFPGEVATVTGPRIEYVTFLVAGTLAGLFFDDLDYSSCPWDLDGSGEVGIVDFLDLLAAWGACAGCPQDVDADGTVGITDFLQVLASWGACPS